GPADGQTPGLRRISARARGDREGLGPRRRENGATDVRTRRHARLEFRRGLGLVVRRARGVVLELRGPERGAARGWQGTGGSCLAPGPRPAGNARRLGVVLLRRSEGLGPGAGGI